MKTPIDSASAGSGATVALINSGANFEKLNLYQITLNGGATILWHGGAPDKLANAAGSYSFTAAGGQSTAANGTYLLGPPLDRGKISVKIGLEPVEVDIKVAAAANDLIGSAQLISFAQARGFDGATVTIYRALLPAWGQPMTGVLIAFSGYVSALKSVSRAGFTMTVSSQTKRMNVNMGPDVFQAGCLNTHGDAACGLVLSGPTFTFPGTVAAGSPTALAFNSNLTNADHFFDKGVVVFTSGANNGVKRAVQTYLNASGALSFAFGFPEPPAPGDTFNATRGCLLTLADCEAQRTTLDAQEHFRAEPFTPPAVLGVGMMADDRTPAEQRAAVVAEAMTWLRVRRGRTPSASRALAWTAEIW